MNLTVNVYTDIPMNVCVCMRVRLCMCVCKQLHAPVAASAVLLLFFVCFKRIMAATTITIGTRLMIVKTI